MFELTPAVAQFVEQDCAKAGIDATVRAAALAAMVRDEIVGRIAALPELHEPGSSDCPKQTPA